MRALSLKKYKETIMGKIWQAVATLKVKKKSNITTRLVNRTITIQIRLHDDYILLEKIL